MRASFCLSAQGLSCGPYGCPVHWWRTCTQPAMCVCSNVSILPFCSRQPRNIDDKWGHDMYEGASSKLFISNLDYGVWNADVKVCSSSIQYSNKICVLSAV